MTKHYTHANGRSKLTVNGKAARIETHQVVGHCCWATLHVGQKQVYTSPDRPYGMTGVAFADAANRCDGGAQYE